MNKKSLIILVTAFNPSNQLTTAFGEKRVRQYVAGLERVVDLSQRFSDFEFVLVDNTISNDWNMSEQLKNIIEKIPNLKTIFFFDNELPSKNKGCGNIISWKKALSEVDLSKYDYCIHFEPRQLLMNFSFFSNFIKHPGNYFRFLKYRVTASTKGWYIRWILKLIPIYRKQVSTGMFSLETKIFLDYVNNRDLNQLVSNNISLEDDMYSVVKKNNAHSVRELGILWHNSFSNEYIVF